ncbi:MAG TPA: TetR/AcrR family transcriptional regulator [Polyangiales bacterium]|nr:TetR/AcrR family transcriptional regulator [Polyangiales bacterium]
MSEVARKRSPRAAYRAPRPARGDPAQTRERLVAAAAEVFNRDGYDGTDTNRIAREAGYSPGLFYKHFPDKKAIFLAVYDAWVAEEWRSIEALLAAPSETTPRELVATIVALHRRWRVFRRSLRALAASDAEIKRGHLAGRKRQLDTLARLRAPHPADRARDLLLLYTLERAADALAEDELGALGVPAAALLALLEQQLAAALSART